MDFVVTLEGGRSYVIPDTAIDSQRRHVKGILTILPKDMPKPVIPEELPSAVDPLDDLKTLKELQAYCIEKSIPPSEWKDIKNVKQLRKKLKELNG